MLTFEGQPVAYTPGQSVLAALEAASIAVETSCRAGVCQSCLMQAADGVLPAASQAGLSPTQTAQGLFMPCVCIPEGPLRVIRAGSARHRARATVVSVEKLSDSVVKLRLEPRSEFPFRPGQFLNLIAEDGLTRTYSIASTPDTIPLLDVHIRLIPGGRMSGTVAALSPGDVLTVSGPAGTCVYEPNEPERTLVLAGVGTGLAPLWGVLNEALSRNHTGAIRLYHGALNAGGLYLAKELEALQYKHANFEYIPCVRDGTDTAKVDLLKAVINGEPAIREATIFLCGDGDLVSKMKRAIFLAGARLDRIHADPFVAAAV